MSDPLRLLIADDDPVMRLLLSAIVGADVLKALKRR
jgi:hypothetical protein